MMLRSTAVILGLVLYLSKPTLAWVKLAAILSTFLDVLIETKYGILIYFFKLSYLSALWNNSKTTLWYVKGRLITLKFRYNITKFRVPQYPIYVTHRDISIIEFNDNSTVCLLTILAHCVPTVDVEDEQ